VEPAKVDIFGVVVDMAAGFIPPFVKRVFDVFPNSFFRGASCAFSFC
jgi:hypothetical protein